METAFCIIAFGVLLLEFKRRALGPMVPQPSLFSFMENRKQFLRSCAPEAACLFAFVALALLLRSRGDTEHFQNQEEVQIWEQIKKEWPILLGADTLLSIQAMLRLVVLLAVLIRGCGPSTPLFGETAALWALGVIARLALTACSKDYRLDGPVGGLTPTLCEVASLPILIRLAAHAMRRKPLTIMLAWAFAATVAGQNYMSLSGSGYADMLFMTAICCDVLSGISFLIRSFQSTSKSFDVSATFTHILMTVQAGLAAYYFITVFTENPHIVAKGHPIEILRIGTTLQLGTYLASAAMFVAHWANSRPSEGETQLPLLFI